MTILQLSQRLASRYLKAGEVDLLPGDAQVALCDAINAATTDYYSLAPARYRRGTISFTLPAPVTLTGVGVTPGSTVLAGANFTDDQRGCTVRLSGDNLWHEAAGPNELFGAYLGPTARSDEQATVYGDAALCGSGVFSTLVGDPRLVRADDPQGVLLRRDDNLRERRTGCRAPQVGRPDTYSLGPTALPGGSRHLFILRVHPLPDVACVVRMDADLAALQFYPDDLTRPLDLPLPEHHALTILLPLAANELSQTARKYWREGATPPDPAAALERITRLPSDFGTPENYVGTPDGW